MGTNSGSGELGYEKRDVRFRPILRFALILVVVAAVMHGVLWWLFEVYVDQRTRATPPRAPLAAGQQDWPEPRLQENPFTDVKEFASGEDVLLATYGWVDPGAGVIHIPIERAKELVVERGFPLWVPSAPAPANGDTP